MVVLDTIEVFMHDFHSQLNSVSTHNELMDQVNQTQSLVHLYMSRVHCRW